MREKWVKLGDIMTKEDLEDFARCIKKISEMGDDEQAEFKEKVCDEIDKLGFKESILYKKDVLK